MQENEIAEYLKAHPSFFENNASLLADIHLPSPHGSGTISLAERQQLAQRDKITALEERYTELLQNAQENDKKTNKMHDFFVRLQRAKNFNAIEQLISHNLTEDFNITDTCLRIWANPMDSKDAENLVFSATPEAIQTWVSDIHHVYCGATPSSINIDDWFMVPAQSMAVLRLENAGVYGYLALASDQEKRFYLGMGTDFLQKLGNHVSAALSRYLTA
jgi:hypothetical protein